MDLEYTHEMCEFFSLICNGIYGTIWIKLGPKIARSIRVTWVRQSVSGNPLQHKIEYGIDILSVFIYKGI